MNLLLSLIDAYTETTLGICLVVYFLLACWTLGVAVPSGLFVPCILIGAMYGHFFPTLLRQVTCTYMNYGTGKCIHVVASHTLHIHVYPLQ